jgi:glyoxylase-like metal-dependent hydrolase (beta-lactamase superfamily II)
MSTQLGYDVFIVEPIPQNAERLPDGTRRMWSPQSTILVYGASDAILVDPPFTFDQAKDIAEWVQASGKNLTHIFATHGHGDHWFTAGLLADQFKAQVVATRGTIKQMHINVAMRESVWDQLFPGQIPETVVTAVPLDDNQLTLEGATLVAVEVGHSDTDDTSVLHVPALGLVVAGDVIYNGVHQYLAESGGGGRDAWRKAIDIVEALKPQWIVTGNKDKRLDDAADRAISETRKYLDSADELLLEHSTAVGFFEAMLERYPRRLNPSALWMSASSLYT